ncbi:MAG: AAA family ATPase [Nitrososphaeria archaeon]|nr:AAA family ATPase [Nitrososphaeria archaeon]
MVKVHGPLEEARPALRRVYVREVVLENFMSHEYSRVRVSRGINLITGPNGAGKSSILLGISVALGQSYTERGERLADLIRRGRDSARVSVVLDNSPVDGERPVRSIPLDTITITRYIKRTGEYWHYVNNRFRTKAEVDQLLRSLGINPNNLLIVMHQNMIEEFAARDDSEKLRMLEDAVGLSSMRERILQAQERLSSLMGEVNAVRRALEEAAAAVEYWKSEVEKLSRKRELESRRTALELEFLWSLARSTELAVRRKSELLDQVRSELFGLRAEEAEVSETLRSRRSALAELLRSGGGDVESVLREVDGLIELAARRGVIGYRIGELEREGRALEREIRALERELDERVRAASERGPRVETDREPSEVQEELKFVALQLSSFGTVVGEAEEMYFMADSKFRSLQIRAEELEQNVRRALEEVEHRKRVWREKLEELVSEVNPVYDEILSSVGGTGAIRVRGLEDPATAKLELYAGFRGNPATLLDARAHSGGERVLATLGFLLAVQSRVKSPFRAVDEFDVHLDPLNRERMMTMLLETARRHGDVQYIIITPGRVPEMEGVNLIVVQNVSGRSIVTGGQG